MTPLKALGVRKCSMVLALCVLTFALGAVIGCSSPTGTTPTATPTTAPTAIPVPTTIAPPNLSGQWQGAFTYYPGGTHQHDSIPFTATLAITQTQDGAFTGYLAESVPYNTTVSISGTEAGSGGIDSAQISYVKQLYGNGTGIFIKFTDPTYMQGNRVALNCTYLAVIDSQGNLKGVWFYPTGQGQANGLPDGTFSFSRS